jgi:hypothetical protein
MDDKSIDQLKHTFEKIHVDDDKPREDGQQA